MNRNRGKRITVLALGLALSALVLSQLFLSTGLQTQARRPDLPGSRPKDPGPQPIAEYMPYEFLFLRIQFFTNRKMPESQLLALLQKELGINAEQAQIVKQIALNSLDEVKQHDERAKIVIKQIKSRYPNGKIQRGQPLPDESPELTAMRQERNAILLRARASLQGLLDEKGFKALDEGVKRKLDKSAPAHRQLDKNSEKNRMGL